jgi:hypothetical protein
MTYIILKKDNIDTEHICCAFSDKKCSEGYQMKKSGWQMNLTMATFFSDLTKEPRSLLNMAPQKKHGPDHSAKPFNAWLFLGFRQI